MGLTRKDLEGNLHPNEYADRKAWIDRTSSNDIWAKKIFKDIGILMTSHQANRPYMTACLKSHMPLGLWTTVVYDNYCDPTWTTLDHNAWMPPKDIIEMIDMFIMPHHQVWGGALYPFFWQLKWGAAAMRQFKYIYCINSDMILEKPKGFWDLFKLFEDAQADVMTTGPDYEKPPAANTAGFFIKSQALIDVVQHMQDHFIPWDAYEKFTHEFGNAEGRFGRAIKDLGLKKLDVEPPNDDMLKVPGKGTWYNLAGFRHIHAEHNYAYRNRGIPPHYDLLDKRFMGDEYNQIKEYWDTGDIKILEGWWARD